MDTGLAMYEVHVFLSLATKIAPRAFDGGVVDGNAMRLHDHRTQRALALQLVDLIKLLLLDHSLEHREQLAGQPDVLHAIGFRKPTRHAVHMSERINEAAAQAGVLELAVVLALAEIFSAQRIERIVKLE